METETATFALGCFWGPDAKFGSINGVKRTRVGYAGGEKKDPSYRNLGSHTESVQVEYDPEEISFEELLEVFWDSHDPTERRKTQYRSIIFYHNKEQQKKAQESINKKKEELGDVQTELKPIGNKNSFHIAENYHQKYRLRNSKLMERFKDISEEQFRESEEAAKANGFVAGYLDKNPLD